MKEKYSRKDFLKFIGLGTAALSFPGYKIFRESSYKPKIGIQLYTIRKEIEKDFEGSIKKVAETGYSGVETYFLPAEISLERASKVLNDAGLTIFSMHAELPVKENREAALKMADAYKSDLIVYHGWPPDDRYKNTDALKHMVEVYNEISSFLKSKGLRFGLHNHWFEFEKNDEGIYPFYYLLENLDKDMIFELDTYWVKTAGLDPAKVVGDFGRRAPLLHIKDGPAVKGDLMYKHVPVGQGNLDFKSIAEAGGENIKWMIVEFDEYEKNIFDGIRESYSYLAGNGLGEGGK
ncbi:MAG TPA: sugar phosphate isomerase/epimerase [Ignavibacteriaceae bacterium]|nr:sugar phosphate isomerase/epimerase [Ignavibacteriaceae bacterium]